MSLQDSRPRIREQRHLQTLALIVRRCVGRSVCVMANESFDSLVTRNWVNKDYGGIEGSTKTYTVLCGHLKKRERVLCVLYGEELISTYTSST